MPEPRGRRERIDMAVFGAAPGFLRWSLRLVGADLARSAGPAAALLARSAGRGAALDAADPRLAPWLLAYEALGLPAEVPLPPLALAAWAARPGGPPSQGPLLDLVNAFSLRQALPVAAYGLDAAVGDLWLRPSRGLEWHEPLGERRAIAPPIGELILADSADQVLARHWHGAPGRGTLPRPGTREVLVHLDFLPPLSGEAEGLAEALGRLLVGYLGGELSRRPLDRARPWLEWPP